LSEFGTASSNIEGLTASSVNKEKNIALTSVEGDLKIVV
jgi:hypothetical protein